MFQLGIIRIYCSFFKSSEPTNTSVLFRPQAGFRFKIGRENLSLRFYTKLSKAIFLRHRGEHIHTTNKFLTLLRIPLSLVYRCFQISIIFSPILIILIINNRESYPSKLYPAILRSLTQAGSTFLKIGQWGSTRPDIFSKEFCHVLEELQSEAPQHTMAWNEQVIFEDFGIPLQHLFSFFDPIPLGSGIIGQVHQAKLFNAERIVAVKVKHPDIDHSFEIDLKLMMTFALLLHSIPYFRWLHLPDEVFEFSKMMKAQLDLRLEAYNLTRFNRNFILWENIKFPSPIYPFVSSRILLETYENGTPIAKFLKDIHMKNSNPMHDLKKGIAAAGIKSFLQMLFWDNFVHADLHPGNILLQYEDEHSNYPVIVYLDAGLINVLNKNDFKNFNDLVIALIVRGDGQKVAELILERCPQPYISLSSRNQFIIDMQQIVNPFFESSNPLNLKKIDLVDLLFKVFESVRRNQVKLDASFTNLVMSFVCIDGIGHSLDPNINMLPILANGALKYLVVNVAKKISE